MKISDILNLYRQLRNPGLPDQMLIKIISDTEWRIKREIVDTSAEYASYPFDGYAMHDLNRELIAPPPYHWVYVWACIYHTDVKENQTMNANNSYAQMEDFFSQLGKYWIRNHMPKPAPRFRDEMHGI